jgi:hypothetical protein
VKEKEKKKNKIKEINKSLSFFPSDSSRELGQRQRRTDCELISMQ